MSAAGASWARDIEVDITHAQARFSEGDVTHTQKTYKSATAFRDLPFDLIYHDSWLRTEEREEILWAQVILPQLLLLADLSHILC